MNIKKGCLLLMILNLCLVFALLFWDDSRESFGIMSTKANIETMENLQNQSVSTNSPKEYKGKIALTFDDGPYPELTLELLEGLKERDAKATFFVLGQNVVKYQKTMKKMHADGHLIANHTYNHVELTKVGKCTFKDEIIDCNQVIFKITGEYPDYIRPPFGEWDKSLETELGMLPVLWTVDPLDWKVKSTEQIVSHVVNHIKENDIILLHDCYETSIDAALQIVDILKEQGYEFVTVDEIIFD